MLHTFTRTAPAGDNPDGIRSALRHIVTGDAMLVLGGVIPSANSWDETTDEDTGEITLTLRVDDDPAAN